MTYGFIGCGNMAGAVLDGALAKGLFEALQVVLLEKTHALTRQKAEEHGGYPCADYADIIDRSDFLFIGLKPDVFPKALPEFAPLLKEKARPVIVSLAAGVSVEKIEDLLGFTGRPVVRVMSNLNVAIGQGVTALTRNAFVTDEQFGAIKSLFNGLGAAFELEERLFAVFTALAGSGPAFALLFIESLAMGAHRLGMGKKTALEAAARVVFGSAMSFLNDESGAHPWEMIDKVCSPGGTTIEGIFSLEKSGFPAAVAEAVEAAAAKAAKLG